MRTAPVALDSLCLWKEPPSTAPGKILPRHRDADILAAAMIRSPRKALRNTDEALEVSASSRERSHTQVDGSYSPFETVRDC